MPSSRISISFVLLMLSLSQVACTYYARRYHWTREAQRHQNNLPIKDAPQNIDALLPLTEREGHPYFKADFQRALDKSSHSRLSQGNLLTLLLNDKSHIERIKLIGQAKKTVYVATHHMFNDQHGYEFTNAMIGAKKRGLDVRLVLEGGVPQGSFGSTCRRRLFNAGVLVARTPSARSLLTTDMRVHDKILVIDGVIAVTGGQNIGSPWAKGDGFNGYFRDTDVRAVGPVVIDMARRFLHMWRELKPDDEALRRYEIELATAEKQFQEAGRVGHEHYGQWLNAPSVKGLCRFVSQDPHHDNFDLLNTYTILTNSARRHVIFHVPSFNGIGDEQREEFMTNLKRLASSKARRVDVITNGPGLTKNDMLSPFLGSMFARYTLAQVFDSVYDSNINVHIYRAWIHSKVYLFDSHLVAIGGLNLDETSTRWTESAILCMDDGLVDSARHMFAKDLVNSRLMPP